MKIPDFSIKIGFSINSTYIDIIDIEIERSFNNYEIHILNIAKDDVCKFVLFSYINMYGFTLFTRHIKP